MAVTLETPKEPAGTFVLSVRDDGPGLSDEALARLNARDRDSEAARPRAMDEGGLGLRIVRKVAERHGIEFRLRRREGGGLVAELIGPRQSVRVP